MQKLQVSRGSVLTAIGAAVLGLLAVFASFYFTQCPLPTPAAGEGQVTASLTSELQTTVNGVTVPLHIKVKNEGQQALADLKIGFSVYYAAGSGKVLVGDLVGQTGYTLPAGKEQEAVLTWTTPRYAPSGDYTFVPAVYAAGQQIANTAQGSQTLTVSGEFPDQPVLQPDYTFDKSSGTLTATVRNLGSQAAAAELRILQHATPFTALDRTTSEASKQAVTIPAKGSYAVTFTANKNSAWEGLEVVLTVHDFTTRLMVPLQDSGTLSGPLTASNAQCAKRKALNTLWALGAVLILAFGYLFYRLHRKPHSYPL